MEPKEHHWKTRLTKNEKMTITLAEDMVRSTTNISDKLFGAMAIELRRCFSVSDAIVYKYTTAFVYFYLIFYLLTS